MNWMALGLILLALLCAWLAVQAVKYRLTVIGLVDYLISSCGESLDEDTLERICRDAGKIIVKHYTGEDAD